MSRAELYVVGQFVLFAALALSLILFPAGQVFLLRMIGLIAIIVAFVILALAIFEFRARTAILPNITPAPNSRVELVTSGIYAHIRHPIYISVLLGAIGIALAHGHLAVMIIALVMVVFFTFKAMYEEKLLRAIYPEYGDYMRRSGRFLPFL